MEPVNAKTERNEEIRRRVMAGERLAALAKEYGVSRQRIYQITGRSNWREQHMGARNDDITGRYMAGESATGIAREYGITRQHVYYIVKRSGFDTAKNRTDRDEQIANRFKGGDNVGKIASDFGISPQRVYDIAHGRDLWRREPREMEPVG